LEFFGLRNFFQLFFLSLFLSFSAAFIHPSPGYSVTTPSSGLRKMFHFFRLRLFLFFNFLTLSRFARQIDFISIDIKSHLSAKAQQLFDIFWKFAIFFISNLFFIPVCRSPSLSFFVAVFHLLSSANFFIQAFIFSRLIVFVQYPRKKCEPI
jgi:hypothetical protein